MGAERGLFIVYTGDGKGKTTAALGLGLRAVGQGLRVRMIQFIKSDRPCGEREAARHLPGFEIVATGRGFTWDRSHSPEEHRDGIRRGWELARESLASGRYDLVILDELNNVFHVRDFPVADILTVEQVLEAVRSRPAGVHVVVTGRGSPPEFVEAADLVTEMRNVKHPYDRGTGAVRGIEW